MAGRPDLNDIRINQRDAKTSLRDKVAALNPFKQLAFAPVAA
jgi:hypothetical protein